MADASPVLGAPAPSALRQGGRVVLRSWRLRPFAHLAASTGAVVYALASIGFSRALGSVTDSVVVPRLEGEAVAAPTMWWAFAVLAGMGSLRAFGAIGRRWFQSLAEYGTQRVWREQLVDQYVDLPLAFHRAVPAGQLLAHADTDVERSTRMLKPLAFAVGTFALAIGSFIALLGIHPLFGAVAVVLFPTLSWLNRIYSDRVSLPAQREREENGVVSSITHESFDGALVVKTLGREDDEVARLAEAADRLRGTRVEVGRLRSWFDPVLEVLPNVGIVAVVSIGAWLVQDGAVSVGELITAVSLFTILSVPVRVVGFFLEEMPGSAAALARVDSVVDVPADPDDRRGQSTVAPGAQKVVVDDVSYSYSSIDGEAEAVLDRVSFVVPAGASVAIVGATGSGKSTIVQLIAGLATPAQGRVLIGEVPVGELDEDERAARIATVFQEAFLFATTIRENVALGRSVPDDDIIDALREAQAWDFVQELDDGLNEVVGERGVTLSGGQRQRVALARALLRGPSVVLLDDATSALDPAIERRVLDALRAKADATLVIVAYRLATIEIADTVLFVVDGRLVASGSHQELMDRDDYSSLVRAYEHATQS